MQFEFVFFEEDIIKSRDVKKHIYTFYRDAAGRMRIFMAHFTWVPEPVCCRAVSAVQCTHFSLGVKTLKKQLLHQKQLDSTVEATVKMTTTKENIEDLKSSVQYLADQNIGLQKRLEQTNLICLTMAERIEALGELIAGFRYLLIIILYTFIIKMFYFTNILERRLQYLEENNSKYEEWTDGLFQLLRNCEQFEYRMSILEKKEAFENAKLKIKVDDVMDNMKKREIKEEHFEKKIKLLKKATAEEIVLIQQDVKKLSDKYDLCSISQRREIPTKYENQLQIENKICPPDDFQHFLQNIAQHKPATIQQDQDHYNSMIQDQDQELNFIFEFEFCKYEYWIWRYGDIGYWLQEQAEEFLLKNNYKVKSMGWRVRDFPDNDYDHDYDHSTTIIWELDSC